MPCVIISTTYLSASLRAELPHDWVGTQSGVAAGVGVDVGVFGTAPLPTTELLRKDKLLSARAACNGLFAISIENYCLPQITTVESKTIF